MTELGIKRSRLNQISGHELRVGKRRIDRYMRPYYRRVDIMAYKDRTRSAVTKQQSSKALIEAAQLIEVRIKALLQSTDQQLQQTLNYSIRQLRSELMHFFLQQDGLKQQQTMVAQQEKIIGAIESICHLVRENSAMESIGKLQQLIVQHFHDVQQLLKEQSEVLSSLHQQQQTLEQQTLSAINLIEGSIEQARITRRVLAPSAEIPIKKQRLRSPRKQLAWGSIYHP